MILCINIPGNKVILSGNIFGAPIKLPHIPPYPGEGYKRTLDFLIEKEIKPYCTESELNKTQGLLQKYEGLEPNTIFCLSYALQEGKFEEIAKKFEDFYKEDLSKGTTFLYNPLFRCCSTENVKFFRGIEKEVNAQKYSLNETEIDQILAKYNI